MFINVKFAGGEMSGKLNAKYKFELVDNFNYLISKKQLSEFEPNSEEGEEENIED